MGHESLLTCFCAYFLSMTGLFKGKSLRNLRVHDVKNRYLYRFLYFIPVVTLLLCFFLNLNTVLLIRMFVKFIGGLVCLGILMS